MVQWLWDSYFWACEQVLDEQNHLRLKASTCNKLFRVNILIYVVHKSSSFHEGLCHSLLVFAHQIMNENTDLQFSQINPWAHPWSTSKSQEAKSSHWFLKQKIFMCISTIIRINKNNYAVNTYIESGWVKLLWFRENTWVLVNRNYI